MTAYLLFRHVFMLVILKMLCLIGASRVHFILDGRPRLCFFHVILEDPFVIPAVQVWVRDKKPDATGGV